MLSHTFPKTVYLFTLFVGALIIFSLLQIQDFNSVRSRFEHTIRSLGFGPFRRISDVSPTHEPKHVVNSITDQTLYSTVGIVKRPSVLLVQKGRTGNQLFQYACHYALARKHNWPLYIYRSSADRPPKPTSFVLDQFNIPIFPWNTVDETWVTTGGLEVNDSALLTGVVPNDSIIQLSPGYYCQSESFFARYKNEILEYFEINVEPNPVIMDWVQRINAAEMSVAVHIRRGDFVRLKISAPLSFYRDCIRRIADRLKGQMLSFYIFSDDIEYVKKNLFYGDENLTSKFAFHMVSKSKSEMGANPGVQELYLMSLCKHQIISSSSFSWWAAYLNKNPEKMVYAAHFNLTFIGSLTSDPVAKEFHLWEYRHIYYPTDWIAIDPDWSGTE